jgi:hypothetical protein
VLRIQEKRGSLCLTIFAALLSILCCGCGSNSSNNSMSNNSMSPAQAQAVTDQVVQALTASLGAAISSNSRGTNGVRSGETNENRRSLASLVSDLHPDATGGCTSTATGENCNWPISLTNDPCDGTQGGTISVTGDIAGTLSNAGAGSVSGQFTITPTNCSVSNLIVNGDPSISIAGEINFTSGIVPTYPITFTETGGISYGPNPSGSCQLNATYTINSLSSCTVSGTVCGQSVTGSC